MQTASWWRLPQIWATLPISDALSGSFSALQSSHPQDGLAGYVMF